MSALNAGFPTGPLVNPATGEINPAWRLFLLSIYTRTGGAVGLSTGSAATVTALADETAAREAADTAASNALAAESIARAAADATNAAAIAAEASARRMDRGNNGAALSIEIAARIAGDAALSTALAAETTARQAGDTAVHILALNFIAMPTSDPGGGQLWLNGNAVWIGSASGIELALEDASGHWLTEDGTGYWSWGT